jgi:hypothetical protein
VWRVLVRLPRWAVMLLGVTVGLLLVLAALAAGSVLIAVAQAAGVQTYNAPVCGTAWTTIRTTTTYFHVYNDDFGDGGYTCLRAEQHHTDFQISTAAGSGFHAYPNISSGWESGRYACTGHSGACYRYPVQVKADGDPVTSMAAWLAPGRYDLSWDIWTNKTDAHPAQDDGTEVMIWLAHPGIREGVDRVVRVDGVTWDVTTWMCHRNGASWRLLIYYAAHPRSSASGLHLNDFFHEAEGHGEMSSSYWVTGVDAGFELVSGGVDDNIHSYSLTGVK